MKDYDMQIKKYSGISNPSGAVALSNDLLVIADDEDNLLRIYDKNIVEQPLQTIKLSSVFKNIIKDGEDLEIDLESAAEVDGIYFWIGSHSSSRTGEFRPSRHRLFALEINPGTKGKFTASAVGGIYTTLISDLTKDYRFDNWNLDEANKNQAKSINGLSIEGLAATKNKGLLIGFRNPLVGGKIKNDRLVNGKALVVELLNPFAVIHGENAQFADPIELDFNGYGVREITRRKKNKYLIVAGPYHENIETENHKLEKTRLYTWSKKSGKLNQFKKVDLGNLNIEAAVFYPGNFDQVQLLSDDGKLTGLNAFRSIELTL